MPADCTERAVFTTLSFGSLTTADQQEVGDDARAGLDSSTALSLVQTIHSLALKGHTILCTIHQPRTLIFDLFDHLLVMQAGCVVYDGGVAACVRYFEAAGFSLPPRTNPADWLMDVLKGDLKRAHGPALPALWRRARQQQQGDQEVWEGGNQVWEGDHQAISDARMSVPTLEEPAAGAEEKARGAAGGSGGVVVDVGRAAEMEDLGKYATSFWVQFVVLLERAFKQQSRAALTTVNLVQTCTYAFMTSAFWWQIKDSESTMADRTSLLFFIVIAQSNAVSATSSFGLLLVDWAFRNTD